MGDRVLSILVGQQQPDLTPLFKLHSGLTGTEFRQEYVHGIDPSEKLKTLMGEFDLLVVNSHAKAEAARSQGLLEPHESPVARAHEPWLRAPDFGWVTHSAWPRTVIVNRKLLPDLKDWPTRMEDFTTERFRSKVAVARISEETTVAHISAIRAAMGDTAAFDLLDRMFANGLRTHHRSNRLVRDTLIAEGTLAGLVNSMNIHDSLMAGEPVGEAWTDQDAGGIGVYVEGHAIAVVKGAPHPDAARRFVDWLLSPEPQSILARKYGETPVNPKAVHGMVKPLAEIRRMDAPFARVIALRDSTRAYLAAKGMDATSQTREVGEAAFTAMVAGKA